MSRFATSERLTRNLPGLRISAAMHTQLKELAARDNRDMSDQARYCLTLGITVAEKQGLEPYLRSLIRDMIQTERTTTPAEGKKEEREREREREQKMSQAKWRGATPSTKLNPR